MKEGYTVDTKLPLSEQPTRTACTGVLLLLLVGSVAVVERRSALCWCSRPLGAMAYEADEVVPTLRLKCADYRMVVIGCAHVQRCPLLLNLLSVAAEIAVPFSENDIYAWTKYMNHVSDLQDVGFLECLTIMQVLTWPLLLCTHMPYTVHPGHFMH